VCGCRERSMTMESAQAQAWAAPPGLVSKRVLAAAREAHASGCALEDCTSCPRCSELATAELDARRLRSRRGPARSGHHAVVERPASSELQDSPPPDGSLYASGPSARNGLRSLRRLRDALRAPLRAPPDAGVRHGPGGGLSSPRPIGGSTPCQMHRISPNLNPSL